MTNTIKEILRILDSTIDQLKRVAQELKENKHSYDTKLNISNEAKKKSQECQKKP